MPACAAYTKRLSRGAFLGYTIQGVHCRESFVGVMLVCTVLHICTFMSQRYHTRNVITVNTVPGVGSTTHPTGGSAGTICLRLKALYKFAVLGCKSDYFSRFHTKIMVIIIFIYN